MTAPSGEQVEIAYGDQRAVVVEVGGGLRTYSAGGREVLDGYGADEMSPSGRGQVLIPWPNRLEDGQLRVRRAAPPARARRARAAQRDPRARPLGGRGRSADARRGSVVMEHVIHPQPATRSRSRSASSTRSPTQRPRGHDDRDERRRRSAARTAAGAHPYLTLGTEQVDSLVLRCPARTVLTSDERGLPTGEVAGRGHGVRLPAAAARSARRGSTAASPISSATTTAAPASSSSDPTAATPRDALGRRARTAT